jgi:hypothetical protein
MPNRGKVIEFPKPAPEPRDERGLVEVRRCAQAEAVVVRSLLDSEGIPTLCRSRLAHSVHPFSVGDQGEVVIVVPAGLAERARRLLARGIPKRRPPDAGAAPDRPNPRPR